MSRPALVFCLIAVSCLSLPFAAHAQIPGEFANLQLLDPQISKSDLVGTMRDWAGGLGVRCNHCHVGPDDLIGMDFASDDKATKRTARRMLEMSRRINGELLDGLPTVAEGARPQVVSCFTCHRGQSKPPRNIVVELSGIAQSDGVDAAIGRYDELRAEFFGAGAYDLTEAALNRTARSLAEAGHPQDAIKILERNLELYPDSTDGHAMIGLLLLQTGDSEAARPELERALEIDPEHPLATHAMEMLPADASSP